MEIQNVLLIGVVHILMWILAEVDFEKEIKNGR